MVGERFTIKNPDGSFRIPAERLGEFRIEQSGMFIAMFGDMVDKLGNYEELISLKEAGEYAAKRQDNGFCDHKEGAAL